MRRGPFAVPTETEKIEYLLGRVPKSYRRSPFEQFPLEHVLSYQRRISAIKKHFMARNKMTPLGVVYDFWDRTEAATPSGTRKCTKMRWGVKHVCAFPGLVPTTFSLKHCK